MARRISLAEAAAPSEHQHQAAFVRWFRLTYPGVLIFAVPNGAHLAGSERGRAARMERLKAEGLVPGIPDLHVPAWGLWIEMKRLKGGRVSPAQERVMDHLRSIGARVIIARGWDDARAQVAEVAEVAP